MCNNRGEKYLPFLRPIFRLFGLHLKLPADIDMWHLHGEIIKMPGDGEREEEAEEAKINFLLMIMKLWIIYM